MTGGLILDKIVMELRNNNTGDLFPVHIDIYESPLAKKWLNALNDLLSNNYHLEKNYCFFGFPDGRRNAQYLLDQINMCISVINAANLGYTINDNFTLDNTLTSGPVGHDQPGMKLIHDKFNWLHRYFEDLQGVSGNMSQFFLKADDRVRWHIRQLNLLCHEFESLALSIRKKEYAPEWQRPSQLMCWLHAPRFVLDENDYDLFGIESLNRPLGGVFMGVNKAVGKHHWEVFQDEGSNVDDLVTSAMRGQTEGAGDFDIEWANNPGEFEFMKRMLINFRAWLVKNGFDPEDKKLTIGHPQIGQVRLMKSFGTEDYRKIWPILNSHLDVYSIKTSSARQVMDYDWSDVDFVSRQVDVIGKHRTS